MVREPALLSQKQQFLWPSSSIMVDLGRKSGVAIRNDQVVLNSPIVVYTWGPVVEGLKKSGLVTVATKGGYNQLDLKALLDGSRNRRALRQGAHRLDRPQSLQFRIHVCRPGAQPDERRRGDA